jgi:uncharacterized protein (DUF486 family)
MNAILQLRVLNQRLKLGTLWAALCITAAAYFIFRS